MAQRLPLWMASCLPHALGVPASSFLAFLLLAVSPSLHAVAWPDAASFGSPACAASKGGSGTIKAHTDELSQLTAGANGAHRMKGALMIFNADLLGGHRFGSFHLQKAVKRAEYDPKLWGYWVFTDKIGLQNPNACLVQFSDMTSLGMTLKVDNGLKLSQSLYDAAPWPQVLAFINFILGTQYQTSDLYQWVVDGYGLDATAVAKGLVWQTPAYTSVSPVAIPCTMTKGSSEITKFKIDVFWHPVELNTDTNRDGVITESDDEAEDTWTVKRGAFFCVNQSDDNGDGIADAISFNPNTGEPVNEIIENKIGLQPNLARVQLKTAWQREPLPDGFKYFLKVLPQSDGGIGDKAVQGIPSLRAQIGRHMGIPPWRRLRWRKRGQ